MTETLREWFSVNISFDGDAPGEIDDDYIMLGSRFRNIQTDDPEIAVSLFREIKELIEKYEERGCHIGR